jgi:hypothetical protein
MRPRAAFDEINPIRAKFDDRGRREGLPVVASVRWGLAEYG